MKEYTVLEEPVDYFNGIGQAQLPTPTDILLFTRSCKETLQQEALQNRSHHRFVLIFNQKTRGCVHLNNRMLVLEPNQALLVMPFQFHHISRLDSSDLHWLFCTFALKGGAFLEPLRNQVIDLGEETKYRRNNVLKEWLRSSDPSWKSKLQNEQLQACLVSVLIALKQEKLAANQPSGLETGDCLVQNINHSLVELRGRPVAVVDLAEKLNLSESWLRAQFKEVAGIPLGRYLRNYRINRAMELLQTSDQSMAEIAEAAGFGSPQAFSQIFKKETGKTPRAYRGRL